MFGSLGAFNVGVLGVNSTAVLLSLAFRPSFILVVPERCFSIGDSPARCFFIGDSSASSSVGPCEGTGASTCDASARLSLAERLFPEGGGSSTGGWAMMLVAAATAAVVFDV
jgi:hypothetical protein